MSISVSTPQLKYMHQWFYLHLIKLSLNFYYIILQPALTLGQGSWDLKKKSLNQYWSAFKINDTLHRQH